MHNPSFHCGFEHIAARTSTRHQVSPSPFGPADEIGMLNLMTDESRALALAAADASKVFGPLGGLPRGNAIMGRSRRSHLSDLDVAHAARQCQRECIGGRAGAERVGHLLRRLHLDVHPHWDASGRAQPFRAQGVGVEPLHRGETTWAAGRGSRTAPSSSLR